MKTSYVSVNHHNQYDLLGDSEHNHDTEDIRVVETLTAIKMTKRELFCLLRSIKRKSVQNGLSLSGMHFLKVKQSKVNQI